MSKQKTKTRDVITVRWTISDDGSVIGKPVRDKRQRNNKKVKIHSSYGGEIPYNGQECKCEVIYETKARDRNSGTLFVVLISKSKTKRTEPKYAVLFRGPEVAGIRKMFIRVYADDILRKDVDSVYIDIHSPENAFCKKQRELLEQNLGQWNMAIFNLERRFRLLKKGWLSSNNDNFGLICFNIPFSDVDGQIRSEVRGNERIWYYSCNGEFIFEIGKTAIVNGVNQDRVITSMSDFMRTFGNPVKGDFDAAEGRMRYVFRDKQGVESVFFDKVKLSALVSEN